MTVAPPLWLASGSPRRRMLLASVNVSFEVRVPKIDDARLHPGDRTAEAWTMAMAYLKARWVAEELVRGSRDHDPATRGTVLGADTVCSIGGRVLGQPTDAAEASAMLRLLQGAEHDTISGVCLLDLASGRRCLFFDRTRVAIGPIPERELAAYVASDAWQGKAGGYNLSERVDAGWPIAIEGDPATVMGLPLIRLGRLLMAGGVLR